MRRMLLRNVTYANVVSVLVIVAATAGTAWSAAQSDTARAAAKKATAKKITGAHVKDESLTSADFKNGSLNAVEFSATSRTVLRGRTGATGEHGASGATGPQGPTGASGAAGGAAHSIVRFATQASELMRANTAASAPNGAAPKDWDDATYAAYSAGDSNHPGALPGSHPNIAEEYSSQSTYPTTITSNEPVVVQLTGNNQSTTGTIKPTATGLLTATATLTVMKSNHAEVDWDAGRAIHARMRCTLRYANNGQPIGAGSPQLGASEWVSSRAKHKLFTITLTGSEKVTGGPTANYNVGVSCADVDTTGSNQWTFIAGSITAHSIYVES